MTSDSERALGAQRRYTRASKIDAETEAVELSTMEHLPDFL